MMLILNAALDTSLADGRNLAVSLSVLNHTLAVIDQVDGVVSISITVKTHNVDFTVTWIARDDGVLAICFVPV